MHHKKQTILLIDEYDQPFNTLFLNSLKFNRNEELKRHPMIHFIKNFFAYAIRENVEYLKFAFLTGVYRFGKDVSPTAFSNTPEYSILSPDFSDCFGFQESEVKELIQKNKWISDPEKTFEMIRNWYDGYHSLEKPAIYNPMSVAKFFQKKRVDRYWINEGAEFLRQFGRGLEDRYEAALQLALGKSVMVTIDPRLRLTAGTDPALSSFWTVLLAGGFITIVPEPSSSLIQTQDVTNEYLVKIPNQEVLLGFQDLMKSWYAEFLFTAEKLSEVEKIVQSILVGEINQFKTLLENLLLRIEDTHNLSKFYIESYYNGFLTFLFLMKENQYIVHKELFSGYGRADIILEPKREGKPTPQPHLVILELKVSNTFEELSNKALEGLQQIEKQQYWKKFETNAWIQKVTYAGIAFHKKHVEVAFKTLEKKNGSYL